MTLSARQRENVDKIRDQNWLIGQDESIYSKTEVKVTSEQKRQHEVRSKIEDIEEMRRIQKETDLPFE